MPPRISPPSTLAHKRPAPRVRRLLSGAVQLAGGVGLAVAVWAALFDPDPARHQAAVQASAQVQRMASAVTPALDGNEAAAQELKSGAETLLRQVRGLQSGNEELKALPASQQPALAALMPGAEGLAKNGLAVASNQAILKQAALALRAINAESGDLLDTAQAVMASVLQSGAGPAELTYAGDLTMLTQRIAKSANEMFTPEGIKADADFLFGKDINTFAELAQALRNGNAELRVKALKDPTAREHLERLLKQFEQTRAQSKQILNNLPGLVAAREGQQQVVAHSVEVRQQLDALSQDLAPHGSSTWLALFSLGGLLLGWLLRRS